MGYESDRFGCHGGWWDENLGRSMFPWFFSVIRRGGKDERSWG